MSTENIDDLFRRQLDGHETPPGDDLWARLQAAPGAAAPASERPAAAPERIDQLFQQNLATHATPPRRELWERLEDEHLRPRKRRAAAWWPMGMAAAVLILLLAGGPGLWRSFRPAGGPVGTVASQSANGPAGATGQRPATSANAADTSAGVAAQSQSGPATMPAPKAGDVATASPAGQNVAQPSETVISDLNQKILPGRATRPAGPASSASKGGMMAQQSPRRPQGASRQPDAAAASAPLVARTTAQPNTLTQPADEPGLPVVAANLPTSTSSTTTPAGENVPAAAALDASFAATLITVEVRSGAARRPSLGAAVATAAAASQEHPGLGGRLLRQVGHAVRGERLSLAEVTGLPENLTLEATIAGRRVSKSIKL